MPGKVTEIRSEYKSDFVAGTIEKTGELCLVNSEGDTITVQDAYEFMVSQAITGQNEKSLILGMLGCEEGHEILAAAATRYGHNTQDWSGDYLKSLRAKVYKYSKEVFEKPMTIKLHGKGKVREFKIEYAVSRKPRPTAPSSVVERPTTINTKDKESDSQSPAKDKHDNCKMRLSVLIKEFGLAEVMRSYQELARQGTSRTVEKSTVVTTAK